ncbi:MAG TPA: IS701 family transposase [Vicinamibacterales bacterium]
MTTGPARALLRRLGLFLDGFSACFSRRPQREAATRYIDGLFNDSERKSMQAMHGRLGEPGEYQALQHFITHSPWEASRVWTQLRAVVPVRTGILALDDTGFPKQGTQSPGVQRQYCGALGKIGNCQVAVSSALIADGRTWPMAFDLYLPTSWTDDPERCAAAGIPPTVRFREKWRIALAQVRTVLQAGFTITGVVVDADYGANAAFRAGLERLGLAYGVAIRGEATFTVTEVPSPLSAIEIADAAPDDVWETVTWGTGSAGPLTAEFCALRVRPSAGRGDRWLLCERAADGRKYYLVHLPPTATLRELVALARSRWPIEQQYRELKDELGLDHFEGRTYQGWTHHVVLTAVAFTFLQLERARGTDDPRPTLPIVRGWVREIMGLLYVLHNRRLLAMLDSFRRNPPRRR